LNKIRAFERTFRDLLQEPAYRNVKQYIQLIKHMVDQPAAVESPAFFQQVEHSLEFESFEATDIQAMSFYAWLKAKMLRRPYYQVLLELAKSDT
jgi:hypothetical protein